MMLAIAWIPGKKESVRITISSQIAMKTIRQIVQISYQIQ